jgi:hypothetical protein
MTALTGVETTDSIVENKRSNEVATVAGEEAQGSHSKFDSAEFWDSLYVLVEFFGLPTILVLLGLLWFRSHSGA